MACADSDCIQLTEREMTVCQTVCTSDQPIGFSAIRRTVGLHQELVSRILKRLVNYGVVEKSDGKYTRKSGQ